MRQETVNSVGYIVQKDTLKDGNGVRIAREFFFELTKQIGKRANKYFRETGRLPFVQREKQLHSLISASLAQMTPVFDGEVSIYRKRKSYGWVDFYALYKNIDLLFEVKHSYMSIHHGGVRTDTIDKWEEVNKQIQNIDSVNLT
jgi:hypothetical protein